MAEFYVKQWLSEGRAFVCPRQNLRSDLMQLGLVFVDGGIKHRAFIQARYQDVLRGDSPHRLEDVLDMFAKSEADVLRGLVETLNSAGLPIYVFGSVAWEKISGKPYRTDKSDLDLLCDVETFLDLRIVIDAFNAADINLPFNIDGEIRFVNDDCANWREVSAALGHHDEMEVLVKGETGVFMSTLDKLLKFTYAQ
jgi:phosphoribosyl-dephospho-CoA transferase